MISLLAYVALQGLQSPGGGVRLPSGEAVRPQQVQSLEQRSAVPAETEKSLVKAFAETRAPIVFDLPDGYVIAERVGQGIPKLPNDVNALKAICKLRGRQLSLSEGAYVSHRLVVGANSDGPGNAAQQTFSWLAKLQNRNPEQFAALFNGGVELNSLDSQGQSMFLAMWGGVPGADQGMAAGVPVTVRFGVLPRLIRNGAVDMSRNVINAYESALTKPAKKVDILAPKPVPFEQAADGELDFGDGQVLTVADFANRGANQYGLGFDLDPRFSQYPVFVKGHFTKSRLKEALRLVGTGGPTIVVREPLSKSQIHALKRQVLRGAFSALEGLEDSRLDYLRQILDNPGSVDSEALKEYGYKPEDVDRATSVTLSMGIFISSDTQQVTDRKTGQIRMMPTSTGIVFD